LMPVYIPRLLNSIQKYGSWLLETYRNELRGTTNDNKSENNQATNNIRL
jgi:hypothetical protein